MPKAVKGVLVQCDPSIKAIINKIDTARNDFIVEDLDDETALIKETKIAELKERLKEELRDTVKEPEESESD
ncbi:MAG: hypothetical protein M1821_007241 [Bathelium mastoideum]|nr:MAG: hypothetical protein M1821_007241 [Bathelium mastoideum]KAI9694745.1 MAG: hypothetical protein M1822_000361 [Bathelium mastoideum]